ncbi:MAG: hypothetical protein KGM15_03950 [Pseudomonadota bacterium]|nr:hypothetical protein [Pseudomonadota bacterium]
MDDALRAWLVKDILLRHGPTGLAYSAAADADSSIYSLSWRVDRLTTGAVKELSRTLFAEGIDGLLSLCSQQRPTRIRLPFDRLEPNSDCISQGPSVPYGNQVDFSGPYQPYYWELFLHAPMLIARALSNNNRFADARRWLNYVFNPTTTPIVVTADSLRTDDVGTAAAQAMFAHLQAANLITPNGEVAPAATTMAVADFAAAAGLQSTQPEDLRIAAEAQNALVNPFLVTPTSCFWQFLLLRNNAVQDLRTDLQDSPAIAEYERDPFDPHAIARLRTGAYRKAAVMAYLDLLIAWGDQLFTQYTWESVNTASMLYMYACDLLDPAPVDVGPCSRQFPVDFNDILNRYGHTPGGVPEFLIDMEHFVQSGPVERAATPDQPYNDLGTYFCAPENGRLVSYWNITGDRLYKVRHCLNILGQAQPLALFDPPLNPMALVQASATGGAIDAAAFQQPTIPDYRFEVLIARAKELTGAVSGFGAALLAVLEKQDVAALDMLRNTQENALLHMTTRIRAKSVEDATEQIASLTESVANATDRRDYYGNQIAAGLNGVEQAQLRLMAEALAPQALAIGIHGISIGAYLVPDIFGLADGGMQFGDAVNAGAAIADGVAAVANQSASMIGAMNEFLRRAEDWQFQRDNASSDITRLNADLAAANARLASARQELSNHLEQIAQGKVVQTFLAGKFTNEDLYQWMLSRLSGQYYQAYQLALSAAQDAQIAYSFELDRDDAFVSFGYWDSLHKGLLAGEALDISVRQMEQSYLGHNPRRLAIAKTVSLRQVFPREFQKFKWGPDASGEGRGVLNFTLSQALFDCDFPSHYGRKIHALTLTIPAVIGPYQELHATLTQTANYVALTPDPVVAAWLVDRTGEGKSDDPAPPAGILRQNWAPEQQVALSRGVDDGGLFVLDGNDPRYLPFEGTGAVSSWTLSLPPDTNRVNFYLISDVLVTLRYTAKDGGVEFGKNVRALYHGVAPFAWIEGKTIELAQVAPSAWQALLAPPATAAHRRIGFVATDTAFLINLSGVKLLKVMVQLELADPKQSVSTAVGPSEVWTLDFDPTQSPATLFTAGDPGQLTNISVSIYFVASPFAK